MRRIAAVCVLLQYLAAVLAVRVHKTTKVAPWCEIEQNPHWPFAKAKYESQTVEYKGRSLTNAQDFRHECEARGGRSRCHICEQISCGDGKTCPLQLQGVPYTELSGNIPTVTDGAWAVNGAFRYDFGNPSTSHACVMLSGHACIEPTTTDFSSCTVRCFGYGDSTPWQWVEPQPNSVAAGEEIERWEKPPACTQDGMTCALSEGYNPQGYVFTVAGSGNTGDEDGPADDASFDHPEDVAVVDGTRFLFVADTGNNKIRMVRDGVVSTLAGTGAAGYKDGPCSTATFSNPTSIVHRRATDATGEFFTIYVADSANHRIRRIIYREQVSCSVVCFAGLCGDGTFSEGSTRKPATPQAGYADGDGAVARFWYPRGLALLNDQHIVVADSNNHLIRIVLSNTTVITLAGHLVPAEETPEGLPYPGCPPPCLKGAPGYKDGRLQEAEFYFPKDVAVGLNDTVIVADGHRVRSIIFPSIEIFSFEQDSVGGVSTLAGGRSMGDEDGTGEQAQFREPYAVATSKNGHLFVADTVNCRIRRVAPSSDTAQRVGCDTTAVQLVRPSGCTASDQPLDKLGRKVSHYAGSVGYNTHMSSTDGKFIKPCVGSFPPDAAYRDGPDDQRFVIDDNIALLDEVREEGMMIVVRCDLSCEGASDPSAVVYGSGVYGDESHVCAAAQHAGLDLNQPVVLQFWRVARFEAGSPTLQGSVANGITTLDIPAYATRAFNVSRFNTSTVLVRTVAGNPAAELEDSCGYRDAQPALQAAFSLPKGAAVQEDAVLGPDTYLFIADSANNRIRAMSAVCTFACENGGSCTSADTCTCQPGWGGEDCAIPVCETACPANQICVGPNLCSCKPGFGGLNCDEPQCVQECVMGSCVAPDTCSCIDGWFGVNCTTPVCEQTCGNGGNCTDINTCSCPNQWTGPDCRTPVCTQDCHTGLCTAPDTCTCPPQYSGYDCSLPVCHQGYFVAQPPQGGVSAWEYYRSCSFDLWCSATNSFECLQADMEFETIVVPWGAQHRAKTGRKAKPPTCVMLELLTDVISPFQTLDAANISAPFKRYHQFAPYLSNASNPWRGYETPENDHTRPWTYSPDRQVALAELQRVTQGMYVCANGGNCTAPDICECAPGWGGFDCRTPICSQGYYHADQPTFVSGLETAEEVTNFERFLGNNSYRLQWPYSNPSFTTTVEEFVSASLIERHSVTHPGVRYLGPADWSSGSPTQQHQGGYQCSIRAWTAWENRDFVFQHPNFYSRYMDTAVQADGNTYTEWTDMHWPPVHHKSKQTIFKMLGHTFVYTNEGYRLGGTWDRTTAAWTEGTCIIEFARKCSDPEKEFDLQSQLFQVLVQDTDLSYRPRIHYNDEMVISQGAWNAAGGECVDHVIRGCYNNGTCVAPGTCECGPGWGGHDCSIPQCEHDCHHNGNCTLPNTCTCEKGWSGPDCSIPLCAQECQNGGVCVAPDTCRCKQWPTEFRDGRAGGGRPLFQKENGDPQDTGWTGYDCSVPICVQAEKFALVGVGNVALGGHGADAQMECDTVRCPEYDATIITNNGWSFQTGCGYDPLITGCCVKREVDLQYDCYQCATASRQTFSNHFECLNDDIAVVTGLATDDILKPFLQADQTLRLCGRRHSPVPYYVDALNDAVSSKNFRSNLTSAAYLCNVSKWHQGDWIDTADMADMTGIGSIYGLEAGRHVRINYPNYTTTDITDWKAGTKVRGEGVYACHNQGSCVAPDVCTCSDGYEGFDCSVALCRHLQPDGEVSSCQNQGICASKDSCDCVQTSSILWKTHEGANRALTGYTSSDCSVPMCAQGYFDPFCTDLPQAPSGEGCYRCANGGNCTAPDYCTCAEGWTGYDCRTPVCEVVADRLTRKQLDTVNEEKIAQFELDPCGIEYMFGKFMWNNFEHTRGNCTRPNECTCMCKASYDRKMCNSKEENCRGAFQDPMVRFRNILPRGETFGTRSCYHGYEGNVDEFDRMTTCHLDIFRPSFLQRYSQEIIITTSVVGFFLIVMYFFVRRRLKQRYLQVKKERRRSRRSSEESLNDTRQQGAFGHE